MNIVLYSTGCPRCVQLKMLLDNRNVNYTINTSVDEMLALGFDAAPMLAVDGSYMNYSEAVSWIINTYKE